MSQRELILSPSPPPRQSKFEQVYDPSGLSASKEGHSRNQKLKETLKAFESDSEDSFDDTAMRNNKLNQREIELGLIAPEQAIQDPFTANLELPPCLPLPESKKLSLDTDMMFGWRPKLTHTAPIPLKFQSDMVDEIVDLLMNPDHTSEDEDGEKVVLSKIASAYRVRHEVIYQGFRPHNSFIMHEKFSGEDTYDFRYSNVLMSKYNQHAKFRDEKVNSQRPFEGMRSNLPQNCLIFDSHFESGNLDTVIKGPKDEYDIYLRVDSNTRGHTNWFYFSVKGAKPGQKVRFNIMNFSKKESLYKRGMKPYVFSKKLMEQNGTQWEQDGEDITYNQANIRYQGENFSENYYKKFFKLSFKYTFKHEDDTVYFALCPPYTYTKLLKYIESLTYYTDEDGNQRKTKFINESCLCYSLSGVKVPLLTITDPDESDTLIKERPHIVCSGRVHPGETNGSWMMEGFLDQLCNDTPEMKQLRKQYVFKIIPMLNPDGVIMGNHRTGICGNDLNRQYIYPRETLHPTICAIKDLMDDLVNRKKINVFSYIDFHGHSLKKNVFMYGAEFPVYNPNYFKVKILPKMLSKATSMFRFYSCIFRISKGKLSTARAVFSINYGITYCYTLEASYSSFFGENRETLLFNQFTFKEMGSKIAETMHKFGQVLQEEENAKTIDQEALNKSIDGKEDDDSIERGLEDPKEDNKSIDDLSLQGMQKGSNSASMKTIDVEKKKSDKKRVAGKLASINNITNSEPKKSVIVKKRTKSKIISKKIKEKLNGMQNLKGAKSSSALNKLIDEIKDDYKNKALRDESDDYSEGGSDSEDPDDDFDKDEMNKLQKQIAKRIEQFKNIAQSNNTAPKKEEKKVIKATVPPARIIVDKKKKNENRTNERPKTVISNNRKIINTLESQRLGKITPKGNDLSTKITPRPNSNRQSSFKYPVLGEQSNYFPLRPLDKQGLSKNDKILTGSNTTTNDQGKQIILKQADTSVSNTPNPIIADSKPRFKSTATSQERESKTNSVPNSIARQIKDQREKKKSIQPHVPRRRPLPIQTDQLSQQQNMRKLMTPQYQILKQRGNYHQEETAGEEDYDEGSQPTAADQKSGAYEPVNFVHAMNLHQKSNQSSKSSLYQNEQVEISPYTYGMYLQQAAKNPQYATAMLNAGINMENDTIEEALQKIMKEGDKQRLNEYDPSAFSNIFPGSTISNRANTASMKKRSQHNLQPETLEYVNKLSNIRKLLTLEEGVELPRDRFPQTTQESLKPKKKLPISFESYKKTIAMKKKKNATGQNFYQVKPGGLIDQKSYEY